MHPSIPSSNRFVSPLFAAPSLNSPAFPSIFPVFEPKRRRKRRQEEVGSVNLLAFRVLPILGFSDFEKGRRDCWRGRCKVRDGEEGDLGLEAELLEFMKKSENPVAFPTKKQLVDAGRMDLVEAISSQGGWLSWGWDLGDRSGGRDVGPGNEFSNAGGSIIPNGSDNLDTYRETDASAGRVSSSSSANLASSSGRSLELRFKEDMGIEAILSRLEKQRNTSLGLDLEERKNGSQVSSIDSIEDRQPKTPDKGLNKGKLDDLVHNLGENGSLTDYSSWTNTSKAEMWRTWSIQRAGNQDKDFEVGEVSFKESRPRDTTGASKDEIFSLTESSSEAVEKGKEPNASVKESNLNQMQSRLRQLESELSSVLHSLRSKTNESIPQEDQECSPDGLQKLSDAWEFKENEVMNAQNRLRSTRAKLAVLEGKMTVALIDAQKTLAVKQKRIDDAHKALQLLRTTSIVWPNSASEVFLAGSFDGWATQRRMERSSTGVFSLCMKMYPGQYEIKFIVDGHWRIDPLRPIVGNNGYENNILIIT